MKSITIRVDEKTEKMLSVMGNPTKGATLSAETFPRLRYKILDDLSGVFTRAELSVMVDNQNGTMMDPQFMGKQFLVIHLEDGDQLEGLASKWNISMSDLKQKIKNLPETVALMLHFELFAFWLWFDVI